MARIAGPYGLTVDPEAGIVYGRRGRPVGINNRGYVRVSVARRHLGIFAPFAHRVIWEAVHGAIPDGMEINHKNGVKSDNRISNLELTTHQENVQHAFDSGLKSVRGELHPRARLTEQAVAAIRSRYRRHDTANGLRAIGRDFGISEAHVSRIVLGRSWAVDLDLAP